MDYRTDVMNDKDPNLEAAMILEQAEAMFEEAKTNNSQAQAQNRAERIYIDTMKKLNTNHDGLLLQIISFFDNSVDTRPGSNSTFVIPSAIPMDYAATEAEARRLFPEVWRRYKFTVKLVKDLTV